MLEIKKPFFKKLFVVILFVLFTFGIAANFYLYKNLTSIVSSYLPAGFTYKSLSYEFPFSVVLKDVSYKFFAMDSLKVNINLFAFLSGKYDLVNLTTSSLFLILNDYTKKIGPFIGSLKLREDKSLSGNLVGSLFNKTASKNCYIKVSGTLKDIVVDLSVYSADINPLIKQNLKVASFGVTIPLVDIFSKFHIRENRIIFDSVNFKGKNWFAALDGGFFVDIIFGAFRISFNNFVLDLKIENKNFLIEDELSLSGALNLGITSKDSYVEGKLSFKGSKFSGDGKIMDFNSFFKLTLDGRLGKSGRFNADLNFKKDVLWGTIKALSADVSLIKLRDIKGIFDADILFKSAKGGKNSVEIKAIGKNGRWKSLEFDLINVDVAHLNGKWFFRKLQLKRKKSEALLYGEDFKGYKKFYFYIGNWDIKDWAELTGMGIDLEGMLYTSGYFIKQRDGLLRGDGWGIIENVVYNGRKLGSVRGKFVFNNKDVSINYGVLIKDGAGYIITGKLMPNIKLRISPVRVPLSKLLLFVQEVGDFDLFGYLKQYKFTKSLFSEKLVVVGDIFLNKNKFQKQVQWKAVIKTYDLSFFDFRIPKLYVKLSGKGKDNIDISDIAILFDDGSKLVLKGTLKDGVFLKIAVDGKDLPSYLLKPFFEGKGVAGKWGLKSKIIGDLSSNKVSVYGSLFFKRLSVGGFLLDGHVDFGIDKDGFYIKGIDLVDKRVILKSSSNGFKLELNSLQLSQVADFLDLKQPLKGVISGVFKGVGKFYPFNLNGKGSFLINSFVFQNKVSLDALSFDVDVKGKDLLIKNGHCKGKGIDIYFEGNYLKKVKDFYLKAKINSFKLGSVFGDIAGNLKGNITLTRTKGSISGKLDVVVSELNAYIFNVDDVRITGIINNGAFYGDVFLKNKDQTLSLKGVRVPIFGGKWDCVFVIDDKFVSFLSSVVDVSYSKVEVKKLIFKIKGDKYFPHFSGNIDLLLKDVVLKSVKEGFALSELRCGVHVLKNGGLKFLAEAQDKEEKGWLKLSGNLSFLNNEVKVRNFTMKAESFAFKNLFDASGVIDADVRASFLLGQLILRGNILLKDAIIFVSNLESKKPAFVFLDGFKIVLKKGCRLRHKLFDFIVSDSSLYLKGNITYPEIKGNINVIGGNFAFLGTNFKDVKGVLSFSGAGFNRLAVDLEGRSNVGKYLVDIVLSGTVDKLRYKLTSNPPLTEREIEMLFLTKGTPIIKGVSDGDEENNAALWLSLLSQGFRLSVMREVESNLQTLFGLDWLSFEPPCVDENRWIVTAGKLILPDIYVSRRFALDDYRYGGWDVEFFLAPGTSFKWIGEEKENRFMLFFRFRL